MDTNATELRAGPLRCRYADGQLRYLKIGQTELVRRLFLGVRTSTWDTLTPRFTKSYVERGADRFSVHLEAVCERQKAGYDSDGGYQWSGLIEGTPEGVVRFSVTGAPTRDFQTNRIGICVLFGTPGVCDTGYEVVGKSAKTREGRFPRRVNAPLMFEPEFSQIRCRRGDGQFVTVGLEGDGLFSMEDQRNFGDTSFKAYATMPYDYPKLLSGQSRTQRVIVTPEGFPNPTAPVIPPAPELRRIPGVAGHLPEIRFGSKGERNWFNQINNERDKTRAASAISFAYFPVEHLWDDDTCWENVPCIEELAPSARAFAPGKPVDIHHIALTLTHPRPAPEPRNRSAFGAAWAAVCLKHAARAGVRSATFDFGPGPATELLKRLAVHAGAPIESYSVESEALTLPLDAYRIGQKQMVVVNKTAAPQRALLDGRGLSLAPYEVKLL